MTDTTCGISKFYPGPLDEASPELVEGLGTFGVVEGLGPFGEVEGGASKACPLQNTVGRKLTVLVRE